MSKPQDKRMNTSIDYTAPSKGKRYKKPADKRIDMDGDEGQPRAPNRTVTMGDVQPQVPKRHGDPTRRQQQQLGAIPQEFQNHAPTRKETLGVVMQPNFPTRQDDIGFQPQQGRRTNRAARQSSPPPAPLKQEAGEKTNHEIDFEPRRIQKLSAVKEVSERSGGDIVFQPSGRKVGAATEEIAFRPRTKKKQPQRGKIPSTESKIDELVFSQQRPTLRTSHKAGAPAAAGTAEEIRFEPSRGNINKEEKSTTRDIQFRPTPSRKERKPREQEGDIQVRQERPQKTEQTTSPDRQSPRHSTKKSSPKQSQQSPSLWLQADRHKSKLDRRRPTRLERGGRQSSAPDIENSTYTMDKTKKKKEKSKKNVATNDVPQPQFYFSEPLREERVCAARFLVASTAAEQKLYSSMRKSRNQAFDQEAAQEKQQFVVEESTRSVVSDDEETTHHSEDDVSAPPPAALRRHHSDISLDPSAREEVERPRQPRRMTKEFGGLESFRFPTTGESVVHTTTTTRKKRSTKDEDDAELYTKYFKMLSVGIPLRGVKHNMALDYLDPSILDNYRYHRLRWKRSSDKSVVYNDILETDHSTYYKMLNAGVPVEAVRQRMEWEGLDPESLDLNLYNKTKSKLRHEEGDQYDEGDEDLEYAKYFNMLSRNIVMKDVKAEMEKDGLNPDILDNYQYKKVDEHGRKSMVGIIEEGDEEEWDEEEEDEEEITAGLGKYFMMLSIGVPMQAVKQSAYQDGLDPENLDKYQYEKLDWEVTEEDADDAACDEIWDGELGKYYKMLSAGVPVEGVQQRMSIEGWDPSSLDIELYHKAKKKLRKDAAMENTNGDDVKYAKYFNMLGRGVIMADVRKQLERDGLDPDILDAYQYKPV